MAAPTRYRLVADPALPPHAQAASLVLAVLARAKVPSLDRLVEVPWSVVLDDEQVALVQAHPAVCSWVRAKTPDTEANAYLTLCSGCQRCYLTSSSAVPAACPVTSGCAGTQLRVPRAAEVKVDG